MAARPMGKRSYETETGTTKGKKVTFTFDSPTAKTVMLAGSFNKWDHRSTLLHKTEDRLWKRELTLMPGRYEYKFVVDGNWINDPRNHNKVTNPFGTENSIIEIS